LKNGFLKMERMNWNDLRFFLSVARQGGLTGAAKVLSVSQSTVSRRIETLETALDSRLFERQPDGYRLTEAGLDMLSKAEMIEAHLLNLENEYSGRDYKPSGKVSVSSMETLVQDLILPMMPTFQSNYPSVSLELSAVAGQANLSGRESDVALRLSRPKSGPYTVRRIGKLGFGLYASKYYLDRSPLTSDDLAISSTANTDVRTHRVRNHAVLGWPKDLEFTAPAQSLKNWVEGTPVLRLDTASSHHTAVKQGLGVAVLSHLMATRSGELVPVWPDLFHLSSDIWLIVPNDLTRISRIRATCDFLCELIANNANLLERGRPND
jgi:DNA-binding transcriptional LysR family regulator